MAPVAYLRPPAFAPPSTRRQPSGLARLLPTYANLQVEAPWQQWLGTLELINLPASLQVRWVAGVAATLLALLPATPPAPRRWALPDLRVDPAVLSTRELEGSADSIAYALLDAALISRAIHTALRTHGHTRSVHVDVLAPDEQPGMDQTPRGVHLALRHDWLTNVWGRGITTLDGHLVLDAAAHDDTTLALITEAGHITVSARELRR